MIHISCQFAEVWVRMRSQIANQKKTYKVWKLPICKLPLCRRSGNLRFVIRQLCGFASCGTFLLDCLSLTNYSRYTVVSEHWVNCTLTVTHINTNPSYHHLQRMPTPIHPSSTWGKASRNHVNEDRRTIQPNQIKFSSCSAPAPMWTPPINESAELTREALYM
jgi:hypothetical protein